MDFPSGAAADRADATIADLLGPRLGPDRLFTSRSSEITPAGPTISARLSSFRCRSKYQPRTQSIYSDLGFILLGFILEDAEPRSARFTGAAGASNPSQRLPAQFQRLARSFTDQPLTFNPPRPWRRAITADRVRRVAGAGAGRRSPRRKCVGTRWRGGTCGTSSERWGRSAHSRGRSPTLNGHPDPVVDRRDAPASFSALPSASAARAPSAGTPMPPHVVLRNASGGDRNRAHRLHGHIVVDRLGAGPLRGAAHQSRPPDASRGSERRSREAAAARARRGDGRARAIATTAVGFR